jgi:threonine/homoserine/homoserine lactone efflux protein
MLNALLKGFAISLLLVFSVGPLVFTIIKQSINNGRSGGFSFVAGIWLSDLFWIILSNVFSEVVTEMLHFRKEIGFTGSIFLISMGIYYLFFKKIHLKEEEALLKITTGTHAKLVLSGFLINALNPGVMAFWLTTATALAVTNSVQERIVIFSTVLIVNTGVDILKVLLAGKIRKSLNEKNISLINKISGLILLVFGLVLIAGIIYTSPK